MDEVHIEPRYFFGVTISSTFTDLKEHRVASISAINSHDLKHISMENDSAKPIDVLDSSLKMVEEGAAYIGIIGAKYGQIPECPVRNPHNLSITELEFDRAMELGRPILLFIMGDEHPVLKRDIEPDLHKQQKLMAFIAKAKRMDAHSAVHRVYAVFNSLEEFKVKIGPSIAIIKHQLNERRPTQVTTREPDVEPVLNPIPQPPALYAKPPYIASHKFVGRSAQLDVLNDWARPADPYTILLFEAIGGNGKSMLTWEWTTRHATKVRSDWAGIFWYSFYEKGAVMDDFCQRALAYITGCSLEEIGKKKTPDLKELLLHHLNSHPWLIILDGLERVLVAYHRIDAAEIPDEELNTPVDKIVNRNPCSCINDEDQELLRSLAFASPSKILISSRLAPRALFNRAGQPIPGVQRMVLSGLRPPDAEALFRSCGISGASVLIQDYLTTNCDCHPLAIGLLAGLVNDYLPDKGNFDAWMADTANSEQSNLANLDLVSKRNHILKAGMNALPEKGRRLLAVLALLPESVDYQTLVALYPDLPPEPEEVERPVLPEDKWGWGELSGSEKLRSQKWYEFKKQDWDAYQQAMEAWRQSPLYLQALQELTKAVLDLELRGFLQYDHGTKRYDLHPVVRGVAAGGLRAEEKEQYGQRVVDHFSAKAHHLYQEVDTLEDAGNTIHVIRTLIRMGHYEKAWRECIGDLARALCFNLEAYKEYLTLIKPFFPDGWNKFPIVLERIDGSFLINMAALNLSRMGECEESHSAYSTDLLYNLEVFNIQNVRIGLWNISKNQFRIKNPAASKRIVDLSLELANFNNNNNLALFVDRLLQFSILSYSGQWSAAADVWNLLDPMGRDWHRSRYRPGDAEYEYALHQYRLGTLTEEYLDHVDRLTIEGKNRMVIRDLHRLRGIWLMEQGAWLPAVENLGSAIQLARLIEQTDTNAETWLALAKFHLKQLPDAPGEAAYLTRAKKPAHRPLAALYHSMGNNDEAKEHALLAYKWAWDCGEPYVNRHELDQCIVLLKKLDVEIPVLPPYDPAKDIKFPWEDKVVALIEKLKAEKQASEAKKENP